MTPERYRQIGRLYHEALELETRERDGFLVEACAGDEELRREVEALVAAHQQAGDFIGGPPAEVAAAMLADTRGRAMVGRSFGPYQILALLGAGGMGEVYRARDTRLGRAVAVKVLPAHLAANPEALRRFEREAQTVAALSHPNLLAIHDFGNEQGVRYAVMELLEGETLRDRLKHGPLAWRAAAEIALGVAEGLAAAHDRGVIHRDLKPANVFLTGAGQVKILDFGIARVKPALASPARLLTTLDETSRPGMLIGTLGYMSPEQVRGEQAEAQSDIFALGCLLAEALTGRRPFARPTAAETMAAILRDDPPTMGAEVPFELERVVRRCLEKQEADRFESARELAAALRAVLRRGDEVLFSRITERQRNPVRNLTALLVSLVVVATGAYALFGRAGVAEPFRNPRIARLSTNGNAASAAVSRDGKYVAYALDDSGRQSLWVRQVVGGSSIRLLPPAEVEYWGVTFSPDGNNVYFNRGSWPAAAVFRIPALGGEAQQVLNGAVSPVSFSPDGQRVAFVRATPETGETSLVVARADGSDERRLAARRLPESLGAPAWSPDGQLIACPAVTSDSRGSFSAVVVIGLGGGAEQGLGRQRWQGIRELAWLAGGGGLIIAAQDAEASFSQLWQLDYPGGEARPVTSDLSDYLGVSLTADARALLTLQRQRISNIWLAVAGEPAIASPVTTGASRYFDLAWTPDGKLLYASDASGSADIWEMSADGASHRQLTSGAGRNYGPSASPDGRQIVFHSNRTGSWEVWRMDRDGGGLRQLTGGSRHNHFPRVTPDGKWVVYYHRDEHRLVTVWKVPIEGGTPVQLTTQASTRPAVSPDGRLIACRYLDEPTGAPPRVALVPAEGGPPVRIYDLPRTAKLDEIFGVVWGPDGKSLTFIDSRGGVDNIWRLPLAGGEPKPLTDFKSDRIESFAWSPDGLLAFSRGVITSDVMLLHADQTR